MVDVRLKQVLQSDTISFLALGSSSTAAAAGDFSSGDGSTDLAFTASSGLLNVGAGHVRVGSSTGAVALGDLSAGDGTRQMFYDSSSNWLRMSGATAIIGSTSAHDLQLTYNESLRLVVGNTAITTYRQITWPSGQGAMNHLLGPSDQTFSIRPGVSQSIALLSQDGTNGWVIQDGTNTTHQQITYPAGLGALTHLLGPSDQPFTLQPGAGQTLDVNEEGGTTSIRVGTAGQVSFVGNNIDVQDGIEFQFGSSSTYGGAIQARSVEGWHMSTGSNNYLVLTTNANRAQNHDHGAQSTPTLFIHSAADPDVDNTEWASLSVATGGDLNFDLGDSAHSYVFGTGAMSLTSANGESTTTQYASAVVDFSVSGTATGLIPAGALVLAVTTRVLTTISGGGATDYEVGDGTDIDRWGLGGALTAGTTTDPTDFTDNTVQFNNSASAADVVLTGTGGTPTAGTVRVTVAYMSFSAPTS